MDNATRFYEPLISGTDKLIRRPIRPWRKTMLTLLRSAISERDINFDDVAIALNQLALLEAYEGNSANALALCDAQMTFWMSVAAERDRRPYLGYVVQPLINIIRLERWTATPDGPASLYAELSPERRGSHGILQFRHEGLPSIAQLCAAGGRADYEALVDNVYWREYARFLLQTDRTKELQSLLAEGLSRPLSPFIRLALLEILLLQQVRAGKHQAAVRLLGQLNVSASSPQWLHFRVLEMYLAAKTQAPAGPRLMREVMDAARASDFLPLNGYGLNLLFDISKVMRELGRDDEESDLLMRTGQVARQLDDEVVHFEAIERLATLARTSREPVRHQFAQSTYAPIRKRIGLAPAAPDPLSALVLQGACSLARLDYAACSDVLGSTATGTSAIAAVA